jgi:hypothetical protein
MNHRINKLLFIATLTIFMASCNPFEKVFDRGALQPGTGVYEIENFLRVNVSDGMKVSIIKDDNYSISVEGDERNIEDLDVRLVGGAQLTISYKTEMRRRHLTTINIKTPVLQGFRLSRGSQGSIVGFYGNQNFDISLTGGSRASASIASNNLIAKLSDGSKLSIDGGGRTFSANLDNSSEVKAYPYPVLDCYLEMSRKSKAFVTVSGRLAVTANSQSSVEYQGNPTEKDLILLGNSTATPK